MAQLTKLAPVVGRILIAPIFIMAGFGKFADFQGTTQYVASKGLPAVTVLLVAAAVIELLGGLSVLFGYKTRAAALLLALFLVPVTLLFHDFWHYAGMERQMQLTQLMKNLAIQGGLLYLVAYGAGSLSLDAARHRTGWTGGSEAPAGA